MFNRQTIKVMIVKIIEAAKGLSPAAQVAVIIGGSAVACAIVWGIVTLYKKILE